MVTTPHAKTKLWSDALGMADVLADVAAGAPGTRESADLLRGAKRVVATGNGAAYYAAHATWMASLKHPADDAELVCVPAGTLATGFTWRQGDVALVFSSSGELRDVVELLEKSSFPAYALITTRTTSTLATRAAACTVVAVRSQDAVTHSQAFVGNVLAGILLWQQVVRRDLGIDPDAVAGKCAEALETAPEWAAQAVLEEPVRAAVSFGAGGGWSAALETSLLLKEVAGVPTEGMETREGATSGMYALGADQLVLALPTLEDALLAEAEQVCAGRGARVVRVPGGDTASGLLAPVTTFPAALALAIELGRAAGLDVDTPAWTDAYYATARTQP